MIVRKILIFMVVAVGLIASGAMAQPIVPSALLTIDQNRATVVDRIVGQWGDPLAQSNAGISAAQLREILTGLRSDHLLAASLAGSVEGLRDVVSGALVHTDSLVAPALMHTKSLGDTADDLAYTPLVPCRIADTRNAVGPLQAQVTRTFIGYNATSFVSQGGVASNCGVPNGVAALALNIAAVQPAAAGFIRLWPANASMPFASMINYAAGEFATATGTIVPVDSSNNNQFDAWSPAQVDFVADVVGYFRRPTNYGGTHVITGTDATDSGGHANTATGDYSTVGGGNQNTASASVSTVAGGQLNTASGAGASTVAGGASNTASGAYSTVAGGGTNIASGFGSTVAAGYGNTASGSFSFAAGYRAKALADGSFVFGDSTNFDFTSSAPNQFIVAASGGIIMVTNKNFTTGCFMVAGGGTWNCTSDRDAKRDFAPIAPQTILRKVAALPLSMWRYEGEVSGVRHIGPMAQDFRQAFGLGQDERTIALVDSEGVALAAIQGLHQMMQQKDAKLQQQNREISMLKRKLHAIEAKLGLK